MQTVITNLTVKNTCKKLWELYPFLSQDGTFFAIISTEYDTHGNVTADFLDVISYASKLGYEYVNTIVYPTVYKQHVAFLDNVRYIVWMCKSLSKMKFNKDSIREKHIWKDVEWGKRAKNYNPKGKDPGNVWIPTEDDGKAHITKHVLLSDNDVIARLKNMVGCGRSCAVYTENRNLIDLDQSFAPLPECNQSLQKRPEVIFKTSEKMDTIKAKTLNLIVTSPPYWNLKDYYKKGQIGQESYGTYLQRMTVVWNQCYHKLADNGSIWININIRRQEGKIIPLPNDFVKICKKIGFFYKGIFIWHKSSGIPTGDKNIVDRHEYVLLFSKSRDFSVDFTELSHIADYKNPFINGGAFWNINRKAGSVGKKFIHPAIYPNELAKRIIRISTHVGDLVCDPFLGSGTSLIAAICCHRNFIGYEYNEGFKQLIQYRVSLEIPDTAVIYKN